VLGGMDIRPGVVTPRLKPRIPGKALRTRSRGTVEIALDDQNGYIVVEVIAAKISRSAVDIAHEVLGGE
jgi:hypothetical protein